MTTMKAALKPLSELLGDSESNLGYQYKMLRAAGLIHSVVGSGAPPATARDLALFVIGSMARFRDKETGEAASSYKDLANGQGETLLTMMETFITDPAAAHARHPGGVLEVRVFSKQVLIRTDDQIILDFYGVPTKPKGMIMARLLRFDAFDTLNAILLSESTRPGRAKRPKPPRQEMKVAALRTARLDDALDFFTALGLTFQREQHGDGPVHYACEVDGRVFELYPPTKSGVEGFRVME